MMDKFEVKNMDLYYGSFHALKNINIAIPEKEITAFIGPSGCGKSTFLKSLNRMNDLVEGCRISGDILYVDPAYNGRQYLPNYHVLETCARYDFPELRGLTGQRAERTPGSAFCRKTQALAAFCSLLRAARFRHIFLSYNSEGILSPAEIREAMVQVGIPGSFHAAEIPHRRFKSRGNEKAQPMTEYIFHSEKEV